ncbi:MAG: PDZ domain-containing protein, partial [Tidjanibacter sp.]|nr:PDZ domain-containing protein [Tidjanibacter sp.]
MKKTFKHIITFGVVAVGALLLTSAASDPTYKLGKNVEILVNMLRNVSLFYVDEVDADKLTEAAAQGMSRLLDPYTTYLPSESMDDFATMTTGKYGGVGSLIRQKGEWVEFTAPYKDSPADRAGIRPGDRIVEIEGRSAKGMKSAEVSSLLKGDPG